MFAAAAELAFLALYAAVSLVGHFCPLPAAKSYLRRCTEYRRGDRQSTYSLCIIAAKKKRLLPPPPMIIICGESIICQAAILAGSKKRMMEQQQASQCRARTSEEELEQFVVLFKVTGTTKQYWPTTMVNDEISSPR